MGELVMIQNQEGRLAAEGNAHNPIVFELSEYKGRRLLDIRKWYKNKNGDLQRTQKGIALTAASYEILTRVLSNNSEAIQTWFEETSDVGRINGKLQSSRLAREKCNSDLSGFETQESSWQSPEFFDIEAQGGKTILTLNASHPFVKKWQSVSEKLERSSPEHQEMVSQLLNTILFAFGKAKLLSDTDRDPGVEAVIDTLIMNWGIALERNSFDDNDS